MQVTVSGSGFGSAQGTGTVWLGSRYGAVVSWSDTQVVATVASNATSGNVQVQQNGAWSNAVPFTVSTATISSVSPSAGVPGTPVVIAGSGFGAAQGSGQVWLGTVSGVVQSWSDGQIVALVSTGATSGSAMVLQNGVMSNAVPFTVNSLQLTSVSPNSGVAGTPVTFTGVGFGASQGAGEAWLGSMAGQVVSWSDTQIVAAVATGALAGIARVQQNGVWSNSFAFTVPGPDGSVVKLVPHLLNMVVGDTHTIQALNAAQQPVTGLTWASSDTTVVSLSTDDPPILTAVAAGHVTITAGTASADVTVWASAPPAGTVLWSNPGDGSGVAGIVPAVPSPSGVADVFALNSDNTVSAIASDGTTAWTAGLSQLFPHPVVRVIPDFQGGLVAYSENGQIAKLDGTTGQPYPTYDPGDLWLIATGQSWSLGGTGGLGYVWAHPDGTIFTIEYRLQDYPNPSVVGIDPTSGGAKFRVPVGASLSLSANAACFAGSFEWYGQDGTSPPAIIAGDGYFYVPYGCYDPFNWNGTSRSRFQMLLRVNSSGAYDDIQISQWTESSQSEASMFSIMTSADQGVVLTYVSPDGGNNGMAVTTGTSVSVVSLDPVVSDPFGPVAPVLQLEDGSFVGSVWGDGPVMVAFDQSGNILWSVPNVFPKIATGDGGVIAQTYDPDTQDFTGAVFTFDQNGNATGAPRGLPTYSWMGDAYLQQGSVEQISAGLLFVRYDVASSFWAVAEGNYSHNATADALIRTFSDNEASSDITVSSFSQTGANQQTITNVLTDILQGLNSGNYGGCSTWLTGKATDSVSVSIASLVRFNAYGHGQFNKNHTAAFVGQHNLDGTPTGVPDGVGFAVNDTGSFFNAKDGDKTFTVGRRAYAGGTLRAQAAILTHELGHLMNAVGGAAGFKADLGKWQAGRDNDNLVDQYCGKLIGSLK